MANLGELGKIWGPFVHYMKKMELELTCPSCSMVLRRPTLLPCTHIVCSQCVMAKSEYECECPVCMTTCLREDLRPFMQMEKMIIIFKSLDDALVSSIQKLVPQCKADHNSTEGNIQGSQVDESSIKMSLIESPLLAQNNTKEKLQDSKLDMSGMMAKLSTKGSPLSGNNCTEEKVKEELVANVFDVYSSEKYDDVIEAKRQKLNSEHGSDCNNEPLGTSDHAHTKEAVRCAFCHLSKITKSTGPMLHYVNGKPAEPEEVNQSNVEHFHEKCFEWAPKAFFEGDVAKNLENELARASKIKCCKCGQKSAALGCYIESCEKSYHFPCAVELPGCRWDCVHFNLLCPSHSSSKLPYEIVELKWTIKAKRSSLLRDKSKTKQATKTKCSSIQIDSSSVPGQPASTTQEQYDELWIGEPGVCSKWVFCGSDLSASEMELLNKFASMTGASVTGMWKPNVTHVIASTNERGACNRTRKVLMAILNGQWVLTLEWIKTSMVARSPVSEEAYEISLDCYGVSDGPKKGRMRAIQKAAKIFCGLNFYLTDQFEPHYRNFVEELVLAAGGTVLNKIDLVIEGLNAKVFSLGSSFIVYNEDPPQTCELADLEDVVMKRCDEVGALEAKTGFKVIGHMQLLDHIAACSSAADLQKTVVL